MVILHFRLEFNRLADIEWGRSLRRSGSVRGFWCTKHLLIPVWYAETKFGVPNRD